MTIMYLSKENLLIYYCAETVQKLENSMKPDLLGVEAHHI